MFLACQFLQKVLSPEFPELDNLIANWEYWWKSKIFELKMVTFKVGPQQVFRIEIITSKKNCVQNLQHLETFGFLQMVRQGSLALSITDFDLKISMSWVIVAFLETFFKNFLACFFFCFEIALISLG